MGLSVLFVLFVRLIAPVSSVVWHSFFQISSLVLPFAPKSWALSLDMIEFPLSKSRACETNVFQKGLGDLVNCFEKAAYQRDGCFFEWRLQLILSIAAFKVRLGSLNDIAISFALIV